jgi:exopolyphosphatase/guanosine-5'-triphosphate,3'-diphosphate pyrophosphatase
MRLGVVDVGSNTVHLLVVDAHLGARPVPAHAQKSELRLAELSEPDGAISGEGEQRLVAALTEARLAAKELKADDLVAFATSALREAPNGPEVLRRAVSASGVDVQVLDGEDEGRLTFLAVRRWFGWSSGRLLVLDIGGGSLEVAQGLDEEPEVVTSLPLGAGRVTRAYLSSDPPRVAELAALRRHATELCRPVAETLRERGAPDLVVGTSKTFRTLARMAGAAPSSRGPMVRRTLTHGQLAAVVHRLAGMDAMARAEIDGVSASRAMQIVGGAVVADVVMSELGVARMTMCPWALREGVILRRLDWLSVV